MTGTCSAAPTARTPNCAQPGVGEERPTPISVWLAKGDARPPWAVGQSASKNLVTASSTESGS